MPAVCRGDTRDLDIFHCSLPFRLGRSSDVKVNGTGISRQGDVNTPHLRPRFGFCPPHAAPIATGSISVKVNGKGCGRVGDIVRGCTSVATGSSNVFAGG